MKLLGPHWWLASAIAIIAWAAFRTLTPALSPTGSQERAAMESPHGKPVRTGPRDEATEHLAYETARGHLARLKFYTYRPAPIAAYSPDRVAPQEGRIYLVTVAYEGIGYDGGPAAKTVLYRIKCETGICMVMAGPL